LSLTGCSTVVDLSAKDVTQATSAASACSTKASPLTSNGTWNNTGKTFSVAPRQWCADGEWIAVDPAKSMSISVDTGLNDIELPGTDAVQTGTNFRISYYQNPPPQDPEEPLRPYDPVVNCHVLAPGENMTFPPRVGSVDIQATTDAVSTVGPTGYLSSCESYESSDLPAQLLTPSFIVRVKTPGTDPRVIVSGWNG
jgi:hypothetical protein